VRKDGNQNDRQEQHRCCTRPFFSHFPPSPIIYFPPSSFGYIIGMAAMEVQSSFPPKDLAGSARSYVSFEEKREEGM
jgi:hypothetical protein